MEADEIRTDKFYTSSNIVELCGRYIKEHLQIFSNDLVIECSAGNGSFIPLIKSLTNNYRFYDIAPENKEIEQEDFLKIENPINDDDHLIHVITNPPFSKVVKFVKKCCSFADTISFILPRSFQKEHRKSSFPLNFHLVFAMDLPNNSFKTKNNYVKTCFQIWEKRQYTRPKPEPIFPIGFSFVKSVDNPDFALKNHYFKTNSLVITENLDKVKDGPFIKLDEGKKIDKEKLIRELKFYANVGNYPSLTKREATIVLNKHLQ